MGRKLVVWNLVALAVVLALGAVYLVLAHNPVSGESSVVVFLENDPTDIQTLDVTNAYGSYEVYAEDDGYVVDDIPASIVNVEGFYELMYHGCAFGALKTIDAAPKDLAQYGLDDPQAAIDVDKPEDLVLVREILALD